MESGLGSGAKVDLKSKVRVASRVGRWVLESRFDLESKVKVRSCIEARVYSWIESQSLASTPKLGFDLKSRVGLGLKSSFGVRS